MYKTYKYFLELILFTSLLFAAVASAQVSNNTQNLVALTAQAQQYLQMKYSNDPDTIIKVQAPEDSTNLTDCQKIEFSTNTSKPTNGNLRLRAQCVRPEAWTVYLSANIVQKKSFYVAKVKMDPGHVINESDIELKKDFSDNLPFGVVSDPQLLIGKSVTTNINAGTPLTGSGVKNEYVINSGQNVKIIIGGQGFRINAEGKAMNSATVGQNVQVKMASGQIINGIARSGGLVEVVK
jgi:flagella basal body P-ring formation protein FlgA